MDSERRYQHVLACIEANLRKDRPAFPEAGVRTSLCSHGSLDVDEYERTLEVLTGNGDVLQGGGYVTLHRDREHAVDSIEYVVEHADDPRAFVREANRWLS